MAIKIRFDAAGNPEAPTVVLARRNGEKLGQIDAKNISISDSLNDASEMSFKVYKYLDGKECVLWDEIVNFKLVYCVEWNTWFEITVELDESNDIIKTVFATELEHAELGQIMLHNIEINTETDIAREDYKKPTVLFDETDPSISLLNRIMEKAPHYEITHVDSSIASIQRTFTFDNISLYDAFQDIAEEIQCIFILQAQSDGDGELRRTVKVYDLQQYCMNCQHRGDFVGNCPECGSSDIRDGYGDDTTIFVTADELADSIGFTTDTDAVKNCFKLEGGDDLMTATIRNCNPNGTDYLWYFSDDMKHDMPDELVEKIDSYDDLYEYYQKEHVVIENANQALRDYNSLVTKYKAFRDDLETIDVPIVGYPALMNAYYNTIDMNLYLTSSMMPSPETMETDAHKEANKLTTASLSPVAVQNLEVMSNTTADNAVLAMARIIVDTRFKVKIVSSGLTGFLWTGSFEVTNYYDEEDTATTGNIVVQINDDYVDFVRQKVEKQLSRDSDDEVDIVGLFSMDQPNFVNELRKYSLNRLNAFQFACQAALDILIEQGIANKDTWSSGDTNLYDDLYLPYLRKMDAINEEIALREKEIQVVVGKRDADGDIVEMGLQNYLDEYRDEIHDALDFEKYLGEDLWHVFCSYRREDKYSNDNYISDALNNKQLFERAQEFIDRATYEIHKSAEQQHSISSDLKNLLVIDKFKPLVNSFSVGNWLRAMVDDKVYKLRLIEYEIDYDSIDEISVEFSDVIRSKDSASDIQDVLDQAQSMATSYDSVKRQAGDGKNSNDRLNTWVNDGLDLTNMKIVGAADNQNITWDANGLLAREYLPIIDAYDDRQLKLINRGLYVTDDGWETARAGIGNFLFWNPKTQKNEEAYGVIADTIVGNIILSEEVGIYNKNNSITMDEGGFTLTTNADGTTPENIFTIQKENKGSSGESSIEKLLYVDSDGNLTLNGNIHISNSYSDVHTINDLGDADRIVESSTVISSIEADINGLRTEFGKTQQTVSEQGIQISSMSSSIEQNAEQIRLEVTNRQEAIDGAVNDMSTLIEATAGQLRIEISGAVDEAGNAIDIANNSIKHVDVEYGLSDSPTVEPTEWSTDSPQWQAGKYIWQRTKTTNQEGVANYSEAVCIQGAKGQDGINGTNGKDGVNGTSSYFHVAYANSADGSKDFSTTESTNKQYIGTYVDNTPSDSGDHTKYSWTLIKGMDGKNGINGTDGRDGTTYYLHIAYANSADGSEGFSTIDGANKKYIGQCVNTTQADPNTHTSYTWSLFKGADGTNGLPGRDGIDGTSTYVHIKYAPVMPSASNPQISDTPNKYIGICTDNNEKDPTTWQSYTWSKLEGTDGTNGLPGKNGEDGTSSYVHFAYSTSADGKNNFSTTSFNGALYIGVLTDDNVEDSDTYTDYAWSRMKGEDGVDGEAGRGVDDIIEQYAMNTNPSSAPATGWSTAQPEWQSGYYIWTRSEIHWSDGEVTHTDPVLAKAINSANENANWVRSYMIYDSTGLTIGVDGEPISVKMASSGSFQVKRNGTTLADYGSSLNFYNTSGVSMLNINGNAITVGRTSSSYYNTYITSSGFNIRRGTTTIAQYTGNTINLGMNSSAATLNLASNSLIITGSSDGLGGKIANSGGAYFSFISTGYDDTGADSYPSMYSRGGGITCYYGGAGWNTLGTYSYADVLLGGTELYNNSSYGTNSTFYLKDRVKDYLYGFTCLDICYRDSADQNKFRYYCQRVYTKNNAYLGGSSSTYVLRTSLSYNTYGASQMSTTACIIEINMKDGSITFLTDNCGTSTISNSGQSVKSQHPLFITKVVGYR